ncbi:hypothetical protein NZ698_14790 [Chryseobacterium sp. PBS4-4]|uniref:Uncharacterized protein n=1 Tax=Chryseobacterium edaphi TaxID=2976532 RepID=A0ABT2W8Z5_9FLAO|nr:hypothetical protein [Chryseobacterium edaphi]MCU7618465.1 hypothetical protein [Chryseobacterium edaphi]
MMQNCSQHDEDFVHETNISENLQDHHLMSRDSAKSSDEHLYPDPPVRDGDDWRIAPKK